MKGQVYNTFRYSLDGHEHLLYAIYCHFDSSLDAQYNYFGTNNEKQIKASIHGNNVNYSNWLEYRESNILHVNTTEEWKNTLIENIDQLSLIVKPMNELHLSSMQNIAHFLKMLKQAFSGKFPVNMSN